MNLAEAYQIASENGRQKEFCEALYAALSRRMSESQAVEEALGKVRNQVPNKLAMSKNAYAAAFQRAIDDGASEEQARMIALQSAAVRRRR